MDKGYVYILSNPDMPNLVKVGKTSVSPTDRAYNLHTTGVPSPFKVEYWINVNNMSYLERAIHDRLPNRRNGREFFGCTIEHAIKELISCAAESRVQVYGDSRGSEKKVQPKESKLLVPEKINHNIAAEKELVFNFQDYPEWRNVDQELRSLAEENLEASKYHKSMYAKAKDLEGYTGPVKFILYIITLGLIIAYGWVLIWIAPLGAFILYGKIFQDLKYLKDYAPSEDWKMRNDRCLRRKIEIEKSIKIKMLS